MGPGHRKLDEGTHHSLYLKFICNKKFAANNPLVLLSVACKGETEARPAGDTGRLGAAGSARRAETQGCRSSSQLGASWGYSHAGFFYCQNRRGPGAPTCTLGLMPSSPHPRSSGFPAVCLRGVGLMRGCFSLSLDEGILG